MDASEASESRPPYNFTTAEIGALAHLYRGEVYRSTIWRTRLDNTTNWAVAALGLAMSASFAHPEASALPLVLIGVLIVVFFVFEARRYRYFNVWRARARWLETNFYAPMLRGEGSLGTGWEQVLAGIIASLGIISVWLVQLDVGFGVHTYGCWPFKPRLTWERSQSIRCRSQI